MERMDAVVVGAGLAGLTCAYCLAREGMQVLVLERGDHPGSKNVTGGRIYLRPVRPYLPELWDKAPLERQVTKEVITMMSEGAAFSAQFTSDKFCEQPAHSYTILRSRFDKWLGEQVVEKGGFIVPQRRVTDLLKEDGRIAGVVSEGEEIPAHVVIAADGVLSLLAEQAGLRSPLAPRHAAVAIKEVIKLSPSVIEERFGLSPGEGAAHLFFGAITEGVFGGGFLYTNQETISLGLVLGIDSFLQHPATRETHAIFEAFKGRREIVPFIKGGELVEYSAHLIPEGGNKPVPQPFTDGFLVVGDAAGLALNMGITVRGMEFAMASGYLAAQTVKQAKEKGNYSATGLAVYATLLKESFILKDMETFRHSLNVLENPRMTGLYPAWICKVMEDVFWIGEVPKQRVSSSVWKGIRQGLFNLMTLKDLLRLRRI
jgi:electron transfer flavoprotein-quinone oxidoreductase